jgi:hypothetical protein
MQADMASVRTGLSPSVFRPLRVCIFAEAEDDSPFILICDPIMAGSCYDKRLFDINKALSSVINSFVITVRSHAVKICRHQVSRVVPPEAGP